MLKKIKKHEIIPILMIILYLTNFFFNRSSDVQFQATRQTILIQHLLIFARFMLIGVMIYGMRHEFVFEKALWFYTFGLFSGLVLAVWVFIVRYTSSSPFAPFSMFIGVDHPLRYAEIIVVLIHLVSLIPLILNRHYDLLTKGALILIILGQVMFFRSKIDGLSFDTTRVFVHAPYLNVPNNTYTIIYFMTRGIFYTLSALLMTVSIGYILYKLTPLHKKEAPQADL